MADTEGCALFLWTTNRYLGDSFDVLGAWGFRYRQTIVWRKTNAQPVGGSVAPNAEPEVFLDLVESISPPPYLEMFSRRARLGWDVWGNESLSHIELGGKVA